MRINLWGGWYYTGRSFSAHMLPAESAGSSEDDLLRRTDKAYK